jgi:hypothetical protein
VRTVLACLTLLFLPVFAGCLDGPDAPGGPDGDPIDPSLRFRPAIDLGSVSRPGAFGTSCQDSLVDGDCGLGEPSIEVDGAGTIYVTGVCCLTVPPPVYVSRDGGATFTELATTTQVREQFGIEGDFAVDAEGRIYFADIEFAATFQVTVWDKDGAFLHHTKWPAPPLVDRDWIRAEGDGILYYVYNTGATGTNVYKSTDTGMTWTPTAIYTAEYGLGNVALHPGVEICLFGGSLDGMRQLDCSSDGGATWAIEASSLPTGNDAYPVGAYDEAGSLWLANSEGEDERILVARRAADGTWMEAVTVSPAGHHRMPWFATGAAAGTGALCWYGTPDEAIGPASQWFVYVAHSLGNGEGGTWHVGIADPEPVFTGVLARDLLDFFQCEVGPDGAVHLAYSKLLPGTGNEEQLTYVRSEPDAGLAATNFPWGP